MVNQDNTKIGVGILAFAGTLVVGYVLYKQWKKKRDEENANEFPTVAWTEVRRRAGSRGRSGRSGRFVSDPGRVIPIPSETAKEGIFRKRKSAGARLSQIPHLASHGANNSNISVAKSEESLNIVYAEKENAFVIQKDEILQMEREKQVTKGKDVLDDDVSEKQKVKDWSKTEAALMSTSMSKLPVRTSPVPKEHMPAESISKSEGDVAMTSEHSSPAKCVEGSDSEGGAGEAMALPEEPHLLDDQSTIIVGDSEGSDAGAGDTLAEDSPIVSKVGITLSPASSVGSSPAKSPCTANSSGSIESEGGIGELKLDSEVVIRTILQVQKFPNTVDKNVVKDLVDLLKVEEEKLLLTALESVTRCAAFSSNQKTLNDYKCPEELSRLLKVQSEAHLSDTASTDILLVSINNAIMNLSMNMPNQVKLEGCVPILIDLVMHEGTSSSVKLSSLQPLTNLSMTSTYHGQYTRAVQQLYSLLDVGNRGVRIQALKVLVNLSCNPDMVRHLLAAKSPECMLSILDMTADPFLTLRLLTLLANVAATVQKDGITAESLPSNDKAASPETMYMAIYGVNKLSQLRSKIYPFTRHDSEDISQQAAKLYNSLPSC